MSQVKRYLSGQGYSSAAWCVPDKHEVLNLIPSSPPKKCIQFLKTERCWKIGFDAQHNQKKRKRGVVSHKVIAQLSPRFSLCVHSSNLLNTCLPLQALYEVLDNQNWSEDTTFLEVKPPHFTCSSDRKVVLHS